MRTAANWYASAVNTITEDQVLTGWEAAVPEAVAHVERILERLPARERAFVGAMAALPKPERTLTCIAREMGLAKHTDAGPTSQRLDAVRRIITRGKPYTFRPPGRRGVRRRAGLDVDDEVDILGRAC
ncbi:hypothetical protein IM660_18415 [Ruania alkalisoli]|uniref:Uncharacterized protein n=1 Tax=Ruania alkalisoli TaxID=2779775 RepID=A0A7M1SSS4_9MICO|nr:hypothetical protein [Ruania alkalisoli]QOR70535.1 hypothetical protein IM660_18415 [Ruania alkalisoli]